MDTRITKVIALNIMLIGLVLFLSGCGNQVYTPEVSPFSPTLTITTSLPSATVLVTETQLPPYPKSSENFVKKPSISGPDAEKRITELGAGGDLSALKDWYKANGIASSSMLPVIYEEGGDVHWDLAAKGSNGNFLKFTITSGEEADQIVRAMGMVSYLYNQPTFKVSELIKPAELNGTTQQMIWDRSGWSVVGAFRGETLIGWFNADNNTWIVENIVPTPTETIPAEETRVLLSEKIEYQGLKFDFAITLNKNDSYANQILEKYSIEALAINENKPNARELLAKVFAVEFLETYNFQNNANISLEEFISNPEKYPVEIVMRDADRQLRPRRLTLGQIDSFELKIVSSGKNGELYMNMPRYSSIGSGYGFENGKFIMYSGLGPTFTPLEENIKAGFDKESEFYPYLAGYASGNGLLRNALGQMTYTTFLLIEYNKTSDLKSENIFSLYDEVIDLDYVHRPSYLNTNVEEDFKWTKLHEMFSAVIK